MKSSCLSLFSVSLPIRLSRSMNCARARTVSCLYRRFRAVRLLLMSQAIRSCRSAPTLRIIRILLPTVAFSRCFPSHWPNSRLQRSLAMKRSSGEQMQYEASFYKIPPVRLRFRCASCVEVGRHCFGRSHLRLSHSRNGRYFWRSFWHLRRCSWLSRAGRPERIRASTFSCSNS